MTMYLYCATNVPSECMYVSMYIALLLRLTLSTPDNSEAQEATLYRHTHATLPHKR